MAISIGRRKSTWASRLLMAAFAVLLVAPLTLAQDTPAPAQPQEPGAQPARPAQTPDDSDLDREAAEAAQNPNSEDSITVDFVQKEIQTVMHFIGLRSGLNINVEGSISVTLTVIFRNVKPRDAIQNICKANDLEYREDGQFIIIKKRQQSSGLANVVRAEPAADAPEGDEPRYNVAFESQELVAAIMEVAKVTQTQAFIPTLPTEDGQLAAPPTESGEQALERRVQQIQQRRVSMYMRNATPSAIMQKLSEVGDLVIRRDSTLETGYFFEYKRVAPGGTGSEVIDPTEVLESRQYELPGVDVARMKSELTNLLSTRGRIIVDAGTNVMMVIDRQDVIERVDTFVTYVGGLALEKANLSAQLANDPLVVREFAIVRDTADQSLMTAVSQVLTTDGKVHMNTDTNSIVVWERQSRMANLTKLIAALDGQPEQVLITARLVEVTLDSYMGYGLQVFSSQPVDSWKNGVVTGSSENGLGGTTAGGIFNQPAGFAPFVGTFVNDVIDVRLELLANDGKVKTLSQPTQVVSNRKNARIEVGQEIPYVQVQTTGTGTGTSQAQVSFKDVSIVLDVTPTIFDNGIVRLQVTVTVRELIGNVAIEGNNTPVLSKRESKTDVYVRDGETMVMGGLLRERERTDENGLPFLKDIPVFGYLFKSTNIANSKTDLMFFLRPTIVNSVRGPANERDGLHIELDLTPAIDREADADAADIRPGNWRKLGRADRPAHYNQSNRPKTPADVLPGA